MSLSCEEMTKVRSLFTKNEVIFSRNSMGFCDQISHKIKLKKDAVPFRRIYGSMSFEKRKARKKIVEDLERDNLVVHIQGSTIITSTKKGTNLSLGCRLSGSQQTNRKTCWPLPRIIGVIDSLEGNIYFSNIDLLSGNFQMAVEENR